MIEGSRIFLRAVCPEDIPIRYHWFNDAEFTRLYFGRPSFTSYQQVEQDVTLAMAPTVNSGLLELAVQIKDGNVYIGNSYLRKINLLDKSAEFGIYFGNSPYLGMSFGKEATRLMLEYGFRELGLHRIWLTVLAFNHRAISCFEKCGFRREGVLREAVFSGGKFNDIYLMSVLENDIP